VGSYRRGALTSGDIDIIITNKDNNVEAYTKFFEELVKEKIIIEVLTKGKTKSLTIAQLPDHIPRRVDFLYTSPKEYAFALLYFTGSKIFNTVQRQRALELGYTLNEHGLNYMKDGKKGGPVNHDFPDEKSIFSFLGMKYKEPQERKDGRAVQAPAEQAPTEQAPAPAEQAPAEQAPAPAEQAQAPAIIKPKKTTLKKKPTIKVDNLLKFKQEGQSALALFTEKELSALISQANEAYYCTEESDPIMTDNEYDVLREYILSKYPKNKEALEGHTKCAIKIEKNKAKLPYEMWSMDKIKPSTDALTKWKQIYTGPYVISCKLDGISALYSTENKEPKLYTRGNGIIGQDISHLIPHLKLPYMKGLVIRGEIIIKKALFLEKYAKQFANPRNFVAGIVNKKTTDSDKYADLSFVAYEVIKPLLKPSDQFNMLEDTKLAEEQKISALEVVKNETLTFANLTNERLSELLIKWREEYLYEIDGIICIDDKIYPRPTGNPSYAFAFKMVLSDQMAEAKVVDVIWTPSKDGYLKPRVQIEPINLGGVTIEYATGFNAKFIVENNIGVGALIRLIRSGDVIPHITNIVQPASQPLLPTVPYEWNATKVDILLKNKQDDSTVKQKTISGFFTNLDVDGLGPGNIKRMIEAGYDTVPKILALSEADLLKVEGFKMKLAHKIHANINLQLEKADLPELMHASNIFGRGFGTRKLKMILDAYPSVLTEPISTSEKIKKISMIEGMAKKTSEQFVKEIPSFLTFLQTANLQSKLHIENKQEVTKTINKEHPLYGKKWVITGFRDKELIEKLLSYGSEQGSVVNKKTSFLIVKDLEEDNVKIGEAKKHGIPILTPDQVKVKYNV
jgi:NAD-dependent DNA ligase/predicted nucleotidyltransferase